MQFFMHTKSHGEITHVDEEGYTRSTLAYMRAEAFHSARYLMSANVLRGSHPEWQNTFEITDGAGHLLESVIFADTLDGSTPKLEPRATWDA